MHERGRDRAKIATRHRQRLRQRQRPAMSAEALPPEVEAALVPIDATAAEAHAVALRQLYTQFSIAVTAARQHNIKPATLLARLRPETRKLIFIAEATFGRTRTRIHSLAASPWKLGVDEILSAFDETVLSSEDFLSNLCDFSTSGASWEDAYKAIVQASESRRSGTGRRPGISLDRVFVPQDVRDAAAATTPDGVVFRKKTRSQPKKTKGKKAAEREERQEVRYAQPLPQPQ